MVKGTINICCDHKEYLQQAIYSNILGLICQSKFYLQEKIFIIYYSLIVLTCLFPPAFTMAMMMFSVAMKGSS